MKKLLAPKSRWAQTVKRFLRFFLEKDDLELIKVVFSKKNLLLVTFCSDTPKVAFYYSYHCKPLQSKKLKY